MYAGGAGRDPAQQDHLEAQHALRAEMNGLEMVKRIREQLDRNGYKDVEMKIIGGRAVSKMSYDTDIARAMTDALRAVQHPARRAGALLVDPRRLLAGVSLLQPGRRQRVRAGVEPIGMGGAGHGGNAHAATSKKLHHRRRREGYGMAGAEKVAATIIYNFAGKNKPAAAPKATNNN